MEFISSQIFEEPVTSFSLTNHKTPHNCKYHGLKASFHSHWLGRQKYFDGLSQVPRLGELLRQGKHPDSLNYS